MLVRAVPEKKMRGSLTAHTIFSSGLLGSFVFKSCGLWEFVKTLSWWWLSFSKMQVCGWL